MKEEWRYTIKPNYQISDFGRVKNVKTGRILKPVLLRVGYLRVMLGAKNPFYVHILVAMAFHNHKPYGYKLVVNHKDFNKLNNHKNNLEIVTQRKNSNKKHLPSKSKYVGVGWRDDRKHWKAIIQINRKSKYLGSFDSEYAAHLAYQKALKNL